MPHKGRCPAAVTTRNNVGINVSNVAPAQFFLSHKGPFEALGARNARKVAIGIGIQVGGIVAGEAGTEADASEETLPLVMGRDKVSQAAYSRRLSRLIISLLYGTGIRRAELCSLTVGSVDWGRRVLRVRGKGDKMREIPLLPSLCKEISLYLQSVESMDGSERAAQDPLLVTPGGTPVYPVFVDRTVKRELGGVEGISGKKSPHVLRHSLATELLNRGADLNAIKELLGHASLAATQVYTHNSIEKLKSVYVNAHPRAKSGGKNGDQS